MAQPVVPTNPIEPREDANDQGALFDDFYEPLRTDLICVQAALSLSASAEVRDAWSRTVAAFRNLGDVCAAALNGEGL